MSDRRRVNCREYRRQPLLSKPQRANLMKAVYMLVHLNASKKTYVNYTYKLRHILQMSYQELPPDHRRQYEAYAFSLPDTKALEILRWWHWLKEK